jgi:hypothetical protein
LISPAFAHHAVTGIYDDKKPVDFRGTVSKIEWTNPHVILHVDVKDSAGKVVTWACEMGSPNVLIYNGVPKNSIKSGDMIGVQGASARDGSPAARAHFLLFPDGKKVNADHLRAP